MCATMRSALFLRSYNLTTGAKRERELCLRVMQLGGCSIPGHLNSFTLEAELGFLPILTRGERGIPFQIQPPVTIGELPMNVITASPTRRDRKFSDERLIKIYPQGLSIHKLAKELGV